MTYFPILLSNCSDRIFAVIWCLDAVIGYMLSVDLKLCMLDLHAGHAGLVQTYVLDIDMW